MPSRVLTLKREGRINPPNFVPESIQYEVITGSVAYGVSTDMSDMDICGFCIPPKRLVFPHTAGHIPGFGRQQEKFEQYIQHHIVG